MSVFSIKAEGGGARADRDEIRRALSILSPPGEWRELRALPSGRGRVINTEAIELAVEAATSMADESVYWCLNPIQEGAERASKKTVTARRWLLIDIDVTRPKDLSATEAEKAKGSETAIAIIDHLTECGWPAPVMIDSGNGWHLLYRIDLPADALSQQICKAVLAALAERFDSAWAKVDRATHDAPRVSKLPGTWARKGPDTADRPHRECRIVYEPDRLDVVPVELLKGLAAGPAPAAASTASPFKSTASDGAGKTAYVRSAIERECYRVALATAGERNDTLNRAAFALGQFAGWPECNEAEIRSTLYRAAERAGLDRDPGCGERGILQTIASGWAAGKAEPRQRPEDKTAPAAKPLPEGIKLTIGLDEIKPEKVRWLWEDRVATDFITIFAGQTGMGKSYVVCDLAAKLSRGESPAYSGLKHPPIRTLFISEDPPNIMLGPRLLSLNADKGMIRFMTFEAMSQFTLDNLDLLEAVYQESGKPGLIVLDPPSNFLGKIDEHKNAQLRAVLMGIVTWINTHHVACIMITHLNKQIGKGLDAVNRIMGSVAWASTARVTIVFSQDPDTSGQYLCGGSKNNLGPKAETLAFKFVKEDDIARLEWVGKVDKSADDAVNQIKRKPRAESAVEWLEDRFRERREWPSEELRTMAIEYGLSKNSLWEPAVQALPIVKRQRSTMDGKRYWAWVAKDGWPEDRPGEDAGNVGNLGICERKTNEDNTHHRFPISESDRESESNLRRDINETFKPY